MNQTTFERVRAIVADVLEVSEARIDAASSAETIEAWDSLQHLNLILAIEQEFDAQFEPEEMERMSSVGRIVELLDARRGN
ncbi:MAG TPA: acyl carrier protein [Pyrinomonadaceae bacterium]|nr:acyl carrier protein [Pyrinomonadaceae bacterium]